MKSHFIAALAALVHTASGGTVLRFGCSSVTVERLDPLVNLGSNPSPHVYQVIGGNAFASSIASTDVSQIANCTSCTFSQDFSNYWTANLLNRDRYFKARNGTYKRVSQIPNRYLDGEVGGQTVYYTAPYYGSSVTALQAWIPYAHWPPRPTSTWRDYAMERNLLPLLQRSYNARISAAITLRRVRITQSTLFLCLRSSVLVGFEQQSDSLPSGTFETSRPCPATHPVKLPQLMFEVIWDTTTFNDASLRPTDGSQPFVFSQGDNSGYGQHGDYVFGWEGDALQNAMSANCFGATCSALQTQTFDMANRCTVPTTVDEKR
ncbi:hypothetical protein F5Y16DRAFT_405158 [Xylariaceae sp. FL0255]|nr:hypothetical protein F5Y16DRAFT_405158 [Xylariaceae sp. FL0255]